MKGSKKRTRWSRRSGVRQERTLERSSGNYWLLLCLVIVILLGFNLALADPITAVLHARWYPDLTVPQPQWQCVTSGTVAGGVEFHLVVNYEAPVISVNCEYIKAIEQDPSGVHQPPNNPPDTVEGPDYSNSYVVINSDGSINPQYLAACSDAPTSYRMATIFGIMPIKTFKCHNAQYIVKAKYSYVRVVPPPPGGPPMPRYETVYPPEIQITVNFNNLTVETTPQYLIFNPGEANHNTTIHYTLSSAQKKYCTVTISIYSSRGGLVHQETLTNILCPGSYSYTWTGKGNQMPYQYQNRQCAPGIYAYDVEVQGACPYDTDSRCSRCLKITQTKAEFVGGIDNCEEWGGEPVEPVKLKMSYVLEESGVPIRNASSAKVEFFGPDLNKIYEVSSGTVTNPPDTANPIWNEALGNFTADLAGPYICLVSAIDDRADYDKAHRRKPAIEKNDQKNKAVYRVVLDAGHGGNDPGAPGSLLQKDVQRYSWDEADANGWIVEGLEYWLKWHNKSSNKPWIYQYNKTKRLPLWFPRHNGKPPSTPQERKEFEKYREFNIQQLTYPKKEWPGMMPEKATIFISIHCNGLEGIGSTTTDNRAYWRVNDEMNGRYDQTLAQSLTEALGSLRLLPTERHPEGYRPSYREVLQEDWAVLSPTWACYRGTSGCLLETVTLTNYDDEDYVYRDYLNYTSKNSISYLIYLGFNDFIEFLRNKSH